MNNDKLLAKQAIIKEIKEKVLLAYNAAMVASNVYLDYRQHYNSAQIRLMALSAITDHIMDKTISCVNRKEYAKTKAIKDAYRINIPEDKELIDLFN